MKVSRRSRRVKLSYETEQVYCEERRTMCVVRPRVEYKGLSPTQNFSAVSLAMTDKLKKLRDSSKSGASAASAPSTPGGAVVYTGRLSCADFPRPFLSQKPNCKRENTVCSYCTSDLYPKADELTQSINTPSSSSHPRRPPLSPCTTSSASYRTRYSSPHKRHGPVQPQTATLAPRT